ncbi:MAG: FtsX-like permease family protein, partial [bacterium]|nr:FtsX-like permease family protein [bacterium]
HRLATSPGFFVLSVLTLAVGIAATTAIMSVVDAILIRPLPYPDSARLVVPIHDAPGLDFVGFGHAEGTYRLYREHNQVFDDFAIYSEWATTLTGEGHPERLDTLVITPSIFPVLGLAPALGRAFREDDGLPGAPPVVILGDALWRRRFGADPEVIGRSLVLDGVSTEVVGVLAPGVAFPRRGFDAWLAMRIDPAGTALGIFGNDGIARLAAGVTAEAAEADLNRLASNLEAAFPGQRAASVLARAGVAVRTPRLRDEVVGDVASALRILLATMAVVLTIACVNVANLFLVRAERRRHETAVRVAVGATRGALVRSAFAESVIVAVVAGLVGLAGAWTAVRLVVLFAPENKIPRLHEVGIDGRVLAFTAIVALAATIVFGLIPAFAWRRRDLGSALGEGGGHRATAGAHPYLVRRLLVVVQVALALVLTIAAGLMVRSLENLSQVDLGFDPEGVMIAQVALARPEYPDDVAAAAFYDRLLEKLAALPGVEAAGGISALPIAGSFYLQAQALRDFPVAEDAVA